MRLLKTSTHPRVVATLLALIVFGLSSIAIGAKRELFNDDYVGGAESFVSPDSSYTTSEPSIPVRYITPNAPQQDFARPDPAPPSPDRTVASQSQPAKSSSGLSLILVGFGLFGGALFMRRITPDS